MTKTADSVFFLDTNILLTATDEARIQHTAARKVFSQTHSFDTYLAVSGQVLREYLVVATRPLEQNGLGLSPADALVNIDAFRRRVAFYEETEAISLMLIELIDRYGVRGKRIHDANIVASMIAHRLPILVTENGDDFAVYSEIETIDLERFSALERQ